MHSLRIQNRFLHTTVLSLAAAMVVWLTLASPLAAKRPVDMITIEGQSLTHPIEITDTESLESFSPWFRQFIDWKRRKIADPPCRQGHLRSLLPP